MTAFFLACVLQAPPPPPTAPPPRVVATAPSEPVFSYALKAHVYPPDGDGYQWIVPAGGGSVSSVWSPPKYERVFRFVESPPAAATPQSKSSVVYKVYWSTPTMSLIGPAPRSSKELMSAKGARVFFR